jgi:hypothetical protein
LGAAGPAVPVALRGNQSLQALRGRRWRGCGFPAMIRLGRSIGGRAPSGGSAADGRGFRPRRRRPGAPAWAPAARTRRAPGAQQGAPAALGAPRRWPAPPGGRSAQRAAQAQFGRPLGRPSATSRPTGLPSTRARRRRRGCRRPPGRPRPATRQARQGVGVGAGGQRADLVAAANSAPVLAAGSRAARRAARTPRPGRRRCPTGMPTPRRWSTAPGPGAAASGRPRPRLERQHDQRVAGEHGERSPKAACTDGGRGAGASSKQGRSSCTSDAQCSSSMAAAAASASAGRRRRRPGPRPGTAAGGCAHRRETRRGGSLRPGAAGRPGLRRRRRPAPRSIRGSAVRASPNGRTARSPDDGLLWPALLEARALGLPAGWSTPNRSQPASKDKFKRVGRYVPPLFPCFAVSGCRGEESWTERPHPPASPAAMARKAATLSWSLSSNAGSALVLTMITERVGSM